MFPFSLFLIVFSSSFKLFQNCDNDWLGCSSNSTSDVESVTFFLVGSLVFFILIVFFNNWNVLNIWAEFHTCAYVKMTRKRIKTPLIFLSLLESDKPIKGILEELWPNRRIKKIVSKVRCAKCKKNNLKNPELIQKINSILESTRGKCHSLNLPDIRCSYCRNRLIIKSRKGYSIASKTKTFMELPKSFVRSRSGHLASKELKELKEMELIQKLSNRKYSINFEGLFKYIPFWGQNVIDYEEYKSYVVPYGGEKSKLKNVLRDLILLNKKDYHLMSIKEIFKYISKSLGNLPPLEFKKIFEKGYLENLPKDEVDTFLELQKNCWIVEQEREYTNSVLGSLSSKFNPLNYKKCLLKKAKLIELCTKNDFWANAIRKKAKSIKFS